MVAFKFGLKLPSSSFSLLESIEKLIEDKIFNYVELIIKPPFLDTDPFINYDIPYIIHIPNENFGVNIADKTKLKYSLKMIDYAIKFADEFNSKYVILHPGYGSEKTAMNVLSKLEDKRLLLENMPVVGIRGEKCLGFNAQSMLHLNVRNFGICLDFGHAVKASISLKKNYKEIISDFLEFNPRVFHIADGDLKSEMDNHMKISQGEFDLKYFKRCIEKKNSKFVTLETPKADMSLKEDLENLKKLKSIWGL
jgi:deoxyribonuclease-4